MGLFGKSKHEKQVEGLIRVMTNLYDRTTSNTGYAPAVLAFRRPDARYRYMLFCLSTAHAACARAMRNPDAVVNDVGHRVVAFALDDPSTYFGGPTQPQQAATEGGNLLQEYLSRWSSYIDIAGGGNPSAATGLIGGMLHDAESAGAPTDADVKRLWPLAIWIELNLENMRHGFPQ